MAMTEFLQMGALRAPAAKTMGASTLTLRLLLRPDKVHAGAKSKADLHTCTCRCGLFPRRNKLWRLPWGDAVTKAESELSQFDASRMRFGQAASAQSPRRDANFVDQARVAWI
jgi:hypothetical protein